MADSAEANTTEGVSFDELIRFAPPIVFREMINASDNRSFPLRRCVSRQSLGCGSFLDISGFTALTERLASEGADGTEELTIILNQHFTGWSTL